MSDSQKLFHFCAHILNTHKNILNTTKKHILNTHQGGIFQIDKYTLQNRFQGIDEPVRGVECSSSDDLRGEGDGLPPPLVPLQHRRDEHPPRHQRLLQLSHLPLCRKLIQRPGKVPDNY